MYKILWMYMYTKRFIRVYVISYCKDDCTYYYSV